MGFIYYVSFCLVFFPFKAGWNGEVWIHKQRRIRELPWNGYYNCNEAFMNLVVYKIIVLFLFNRWIFQSSITYYLVKTYVNLWKIYSNPFIQPNHKPFEDIHRGMSGLRSAIKLKELFEQVKGLEKQRFSVIFD